MKPRNGRIARLIKGAERKPLKVGERRGGVLRMPPILSLAAWEALAVPSQAELVRLTHEGLDGPAAGPRVIDPPDRPYWDKKA